MSYNPRILSKLELYREHEGYGDYPNEIPVREYVHPKWSTPCCGGMGTGCQHEDYMYEIEHGGY